MSRERCIKQLHEQLEQLQNNMYTLSKLSSATAIQFEDIKKLGRQQSSFFMSSHAVFQAVSEKKELDRQMLIEQQDQHQQSQELQNSQESQSSQ